MERKVGTVSRGIRCPIIRQGDNLVEIAVNSVLDAAKEENFELHDKDVVALTESIVARSQGNYANIKAIAKDIQNKFEDGVVGVIFPILSRNRFSILLRGIASGCKKVILMLSYPSDEVGNALLTYDQLDESGINPYSDVLSLERYRELLKNVETSEVFKKSEVKIWECRNCGHIVVGTNAPEVCPVCAHPQSYFEINVKNY